MLFDRIIEDILGFVRRFLWFEANSESSKKRPYTAVQTWYGDDAVIKLVIGRDTPRAVQTWIYSPKQVRGASGIGNKDLHLYLDVDNAAPLLSDSDALHIARFIAQRKARIEGKFVPTHRLSILWASHFLNPHGFYNYNLVFFGDYDFFNLSVSGEAMPPTLRNPNITPHPMFIQDFNRRVRRNAVAVTENLIKTCLKIPPSKLASMRQQDWHKLVDEVYFRTLRRKPSSLSGVANEPNVLE